MTPKNTYGQPIGEAVLHGAPRPRPHAEELPGQYCTLVRLDPHQHAEALYAAYSATSDDRDWTYLPEGPFNDPGSFRAWAETAAESTDPRHYAVIDNGSGRALGTLALLRHDPANGVIEVGFITFSRAIQRTQISTEAQFLLMRHVFDDLGYRRYEWKCDALNAPSRRAAERLGFSYEGTFRQAVIYKSRNRDTAWFSILDIEWPAIRAAFEAWLDPGNFEEDGTQRQPLLTQHALGQHLPHESSAPAATAQEER